jgi:hypothetical protein
MRLAELGEASGGIAYPAVSVAIKRLEKRVQVDRELSGGSEWGQVNCWPSQGL